nr:hypothetical protein [Tanacetum cinerariifolium]
MSYEECKKIYAEVLILINNRLVRLVDVTVEQWLDLKYENHMTMDINIKKAVMGTWLIRSYKQQFEEYLEKFNYLLKVDTELFTLDNERTKTYEDYEKELNAELCEPWSKDRVPYQMCDHSCKLFCFKNRKDKWPTFSSNDDGFCNGGKLLGMVRVGYMRYFQDYKLYDELTDGNLKEKVLKQKAIYKKSCGDPSQSVIKIYAWLKTCFGNLHELDYELLVKLQDYWWKENDHECSLFTDWRDHIRGPYANYYSNVQDVQEQEDKERCELYDNLRQEPPICKIRRFEMIKYSFEEEEEYVAIKEYEYDDLQEPIKMNVTLTRRYFVT